MDHIPSSLSNAARPNESKPQESVWSVTQAQDKDDLPINPIKDV